MRPPPDQADLERLGLFYFVRPGDDVPMIPAPSPVLKREGSLSEEDQQLTEGDAVKGYGVFSFVFSCVNSSGSWLPICRICARPRQERA